MIRVVTVPEATHQGVLFPESAVVKRYITGEMRGVEFGAAAHNPFNLPGAINVAPVGEVGSRDHTNYDGYRRAQTEMCGAYAVIDVDGTVTRSGLPDASQDYVVSSHVLEHCASPLAAFLEWNRILKPGGVVVCIVPHRDALVHDRDRDVTKVDTIIRAFRDGVDEDTPGLEERYPGVTDRRGHYTVWSPILIVSLITWANTNLGLSWELLELLPIDDKVGNGHMFITRYAPSGSGRAGWRRPAGSAG